MLQSGLCSSPHGRTDSYRTSTVDQSLEKRSKNLKKKHMIRVWYRLKNSDGIRHIYKFTPRKESFRSFVKSQDENLVVAVAKAETDTVRYRNFQTAYGHYEPSHVSSLHGTVLFKLD
jgi:hypothetical protein